MYSRGLNLINNARYAKLPTVNEYEKQLKRILELNKNAVDI